jgi:hypothetical protein
MDLVRVVSLVNLQVGINELKVPKKISNKRPLQTSLVFKASARIEVDL